MRRFALRWRHNDHYSVSNHQPHGCLLNRLFRRRWKKTSKLRVTGLCVGNSPGPLNSPHKGPVTRKMFPFDDVIMSGFDQTKIFTNDIYFGYLYIGLYIHFDQYKKACQWHRYNRHGERFQTIHVVRYEHIEVETRWPPFSRRHFRTHFLERKCYNLINDSLKFVPDGPINNFPVLVQIMAWHRPGDKPLSEPMMIRLPTHICVTRPQWVNTSGSGQNGRRYADIWNVLS